MSDEQHRGRVTMPGEPSPSARIAVRLKDDARLSRDEVEIKLEGRVVEIRHRDAVVLAVPCERLEQDPLGPYMERVTEERAGVLLVGEAPDGYCDSLPKTALVQLLPKGAARDSLYLAVRGLLERVEAKHQAERKARSLNRYRYELGELVEIARALSSERNIDRLLHLILEKSRFITSSDAGSIYVVEGEDPDPTKRMLHFKLSQNDSCDFESSEFEMPVSLRSIAGAAVVTRKPINIEDVYKIGDDAPYGFDQSFDEKVGYRTKSMIAVPMISAEDEVIGVIQLINKKTDGEKLLSTPEAFETDVVGFAEREEELLQTLAAQAGIALENALLYDEIRSIFEGFVVASVQAIEQRDPTTSGHSERVAELSCRLAEVVDHFDSGPYAEASFTRREIQELEYASLLHDFGKIGVRENVLVKAKKLYPHELASIRARFDFLIKQAEVDALARKVELIESGAGKSDLDALDEELVAKRAELTGAMEVILHANEPTVLKEGDFTRLGELMEIQYVDTTGDTKTLLSPEEVASLQVTKGSLNSGELDEIRSHVVHTYNFLERIPWGKSMSRIPEIAGAHHEKLDGSGYPHGVLEPAIPLQSKIMTIADIYDALTARDRPYKKAMPVQRALDILGFEVKDGHIDAELVRLFTEAKVFEVTKES